MAEATPPKPKSEHQVGITNAQENNPDAQIRTLTEQMNALFAKKQYTEAARIALTITALSKDELRETFERHNVRVVRLDHEAFGIYGVLEPSYDLCVEGGTAEILTAATEFGKRHAQQAILVARKLSEGEKDSAARIGLTIVLNAVISVEAAVRLTEIARQEGFAGATFVPKRQGTLTIYHTEDLNLTPDEFQNAALARSEEH